MPKITQRKNKAGEVISYRIRVSRGYDSEGNKLKPPRNDVETQPQHDTPTGGKRGTAAGVAI